MIKLTTLISLFIQSEHTDYIEFSTDNNSWPAELRYKAITIDKLLVNIYKYSGCKELLEKPITRIDQAIPFLGYATRTNNIETINGHTYNRHEGLFIDGIDKEGREVVARVVPVLEIFLHRNVKEKVREDKSNKRNYNIDQIFSENMNEVVDYNIIMTYDNWVILNHKTQKHKYLVVDPERAEYPCAVELVSKEWVADDRYDNAHTKYENDYFGEYDSIYDAGDSTFIKENRLVGWFRVLEEKTKDTN